MPRIYLIRAREDANLTQQELADLIDCERKAVIRWESGERKPQAPLKRKIRAVLHNEDPNLFAICSNQTPRDTVVSDDSIISTLESPEEHDMNKQRRQLIEMGLVTIAVPESVLQSLIERPTIVPERYLAQCAGTIKTCWNLLNSACYEAVDELVHAYLPILCDLAGNPSQHQAQAGSLVVQTKIMQIILSSHRMDDAGRKRLCDEAVHFGHVSHNPFILATALDWQGNTHIFCHREPEQAIPIFHQALASLGEDAQLNRTSICCNLAIAHAQQGDEIPALSYIEQARAAMPKQPETDPLYQCIRCGTSELAQFEGRVYLYLSERLPHYARLAYDTFEASKKEASINEAFLGKTLTQQASAAIQIGDMTHFATCMSQGLLIAHRIGSPRRLIEASEVMEHIPLKWKKETAIKKIQESLPV